MFLLVLESYLRVFDTLLLLPGFVLPLTVGLLGIVMPSARVVTAALESSQARFNVLLFKSRFAFPARLSAQSFSSRSSDSPEHQTRHLSLRILASERSRMQSLSCCFICGWPLEAFPPKYLSG